MKNLLTSLYASSIIKKEEHGGVIVSNRRNKSNFVWQKLLSFILVFISLLGIIGAFGITKSGVAIFSLFSSTMGKFAWIGPFLTLSLAIFIWFSHTSPITEAMPKAYEKKVPRRESKGRNLTLANRNTSKPKNKQVKLATDQRLEREDSIGHEGILLPNGKLESLKGFRKFFSEQEWEKADVPNREDILDLGKDFSTYFGEGKASVKVSNNITSIRGFRHYFEEVQKEVEQEVIQEAEQQDTSKEASNLQRRERNEQASLYIQHEKVQKIEMKNEKPPVITKVQLEGPVKELKDPVKELKGLEELEVQAPAFQQVQTEVSVALEEPVISDSFPEPVTQLLSKKLNNQFDSETSESAIEEVQSLAEEADMSEDESSSSEIPMAQGKLIGVMGELKDGNQEINTQNASSNKNLNSNYPKPRQISWHFPSYSIFNAVSLPEVVQESETPKRLENVLLDFGVKAKVIRVTCGPVITRYELAPAPGVKISKIVNLADDIALALAARDVRIEAPIPGKAAIGIEVPNKAPRAVAFREVIETTAFRENRSKLKLALGKDIANQPVIADLAKMPHLLVAGATGSGKSVCITTIINSILLNSTPNEVKFLMIDPKMVELNLYNGIPHLLAPVVTDPKKAATALKWIVKEMENRYELFAANGVRDIERFNLQVRNQGQANPLPWIVVVIDELADLMLVAPGDVEEAISRLAQMARAAGIHLVIATQRPSVDVITGLIKANIPSRISFAVTSQIDSRTILDAVGAEKLLGKGDMLYAPQGQNKPIRVQGCLLNDEEVLRVINHWKGQGQPEYLDPERLFADSTKTEETNGPDDELFIEAGRLLITTGMASVSFLQRRLKLGYNRAARLMDMLEEQGVVGSYEGSKPRQILLTLEEFNELFG